MLLNAEIERLKREIDALRSGHESLRRSRDEVEKTAREIAAQRDAALRELRDVSHLLDAHVQATRLLCDGASKQAGELYERHHPPMTITPRRDA